MPQNTGTEATTQWSEGSPGGRHVWAELKVVDMHLSGAAVSAWPPSGAWSGPGPRAAGSTSRWSPVTREGVTCSEEAEGTGQAATNPRQKAAAGEPPQEQHLCRHTHSSLPSPKGAAMPAPPGSPP